MKQKVITETSSIGVQQAINNALAYGWFVQSVTVNSETNTWVIILYKTEE